MPTTRASAAATRSSGCDRAGGRGSHWSPAIAAEALATRQAAALFDESSFAKLEVVGPGACSFLQRMAGNDIDRPVGSIVYTQLLDRRGGIQADLTVTRLAAERFMLVTGTAYGNHDAGWLRSNLPDDGSIEIRDVTSSRVCFGLWGPRARDILAPLTRDDVSDGAFPYLTAREISVGSVPLLALRVTYVGELGWELYAPTEYGRSLWSTLWEAGRGARDGRRRLSGDRRAAAREGLPGLVERHHCRRDAIRGGSRVRRRARQGASHRWHMTRSSRRRPPARASACAALSSTTRSTCASATSRSGSRARSSAG